MSAVQCHGSGTAKSPLDQLQQRITNKTGSEVEGIPEGGQCHPGNILAVQVCSAGVIAGSPHLLVLQDWDCIVTNDSLHMRPTLHLTEQ